MTEISGRAAVVTGGGSGIGEGLAMALAAAGASVAVADIQPDEAARVTGAIVAAGGRAAAIRCDVCDRASIAAMRAEAEAALGAISLVFANAGATAFTPLTDMSDADVDWIVQANLMGVLNTARAFLPGMIAAGRGGHIVATASVAGLLPAGMAAHVPYSAAKAGVIAAMMNLAIELAPHGIRTTSYCPGGVASRMKARNGSYRPDRFGGPEESVVHPAVDNPLGSLAFYRPEHVAPMVLDAVRADRPLVLDHPEQRAGFRQLYADVVEACFDDAEAWHRAHGTPPANPTGADLTD